MNLFMKRNNALFYTYMLGFACFLMISITSCYEAEKSNLIKAESLIVNKNNKAKKSCCTSSKLARFTKN